MKLNKGWFTVDCFVLKQTDGPEIALAAIDAYTLRDLATVSRIVDEERGYQRLVNNRKLAAIKRYVETPEAVLPTGIVLATGEKPGLVRIDNRTALDSTGRIFSAQLSVKASGSYKPFLVIDGQHRLFGITLSRISPYPVPVTILLGASKLQQMANFEVINNRATRIAAAHLNELRASMYDLTAEETTKLNNLLGHLGMASLSAAAIVSELNGSAMAFEAILDYPSNKKAGFISSNTLVQNVERSREGGFLSFLEEDNDDHLTAYNALWMGIKQKFAKRWQHEVGLFAEFARGQKNKSEARAGLKLLHSGSIAVVGQIADKELASSSYRGKWREDPNRIMGLVAKEIFAALPDNFWDNNKLEVDNTGKGRARLRKEIEETMVPGGDLL